jgi:two-component system cell cycle response regulator DivK
MGESTVETRTVLVVDDSDDIRELIRLMLQMKGCLVVEATNGENAVEVAGRVYPNLILMDLSMPVLDGYEATRQIKAQPALSGIPVVAVSAFCDLQNREKAIAAGCVECINKPINFVAIGDVIERYLHGQG